MNSDNYSKVIPVEDHAILSPSMAAMWIRKDPDDIESMIPIVRSYYATDIGTAIHKFAGLRIDRRLPLNKFEKNDLLSAILDYNPKIPRSVIDIGNYYGTVLNYVNDAIKLGMDSELKLTYSTYCFGTSDAVLFNRNTLRIHDLKTGKLPAKMDQLMAYAALYCLQNKIKPNDISVELRIYQSDDVNIYIPEPEEVYEISEKLVKLSNTVDRIVRGDI